MMEIKDLKSKMTACDPRDKYNLTEFYIDRYDNDGYRWWNTGRWICPDKKMSEILSAPHNEIIIEGSAIGKAFKKAFGSLPEMEKWCRDNANPTYKTRWTDDEFDAYYDGDRCVCWFHMITRKGDYNCYMRHYLKEVS